MDRIYGIRTNKGFYNRAFAGKEAYYSKTEVSEFDTKEEAEEMIKTLGDDAEVVITHEEM